VDLWDAEVTPEVLTAVAVEALVAQQCLESWGKKAMKYCQQNGKDFPFNRRPVKFNCGVN